MRRTVADELISMTNASYNTQHIAWDQSRARRWTELESYMNDIHRNDHVLDLGCGNGRLHPLIKERGAQYVGCDASAALIHTARMHYPGATFIHTNGHRLPFQDHTFDRIYSVAVLHHIPGHFYRNMWAEELYRITKPGGTCVVTVWDVWHKYRMLLLQESIKSILHKNPYDIGDLVLPLFSAETPRYVHGFTVWGIKRLFRRAGFIVQYCKKEKHGSKERNIICVLQRLP